MQKTIVGEALHAKGADGARRAKRWLEGTSRAEVPWVNPDRGAAEKLAGAWPVDRETFSFDLLGFFRHGDLEGKTFFAEVKNYASGSTLGQQYKEYLAKCYVMIELQPGFSDHFMWIAWAPHGVTQWADLCSSSWVTEAVIEQRARIFDVGISEDDARARIDMDRCKIVADRLWLIILSEKQEQLVLSLEHLGIIRSHEIGQG
ncbi:MAG TPA: hypothetical protein VMW30_07715 [Candidatus Paceibacterota bacterium]|nr:hypothetical protein [Candidatus Paceibacterota bacterium]